MPCRAFPMHPRPDSGEPVDERTHELVIRSDMQHLSKVRRFVETHARRTGLRDETVDQLRLAVDEACTNVIEHAYRGDDSFELTVTIKADPHRFTVVIRDQGEAFQPQNYHSPDLLDLVEKRRDGGFGVHLMRRLMDRVEYRRRGAYNEVTLTKYVDGFGKHDDVAYNPT